MRPARRRFGHCPPPPPQLLPVALLRRRSGRGRTAVVTFPLSPPFALRQHLTAIELRSAIVPVWSFVIAWAAIGSPASSYERQRQWRQLGAAMHSGGPLHLEEARKRFRATEGRHVESQGRGHQAALPHQPGFRSADAHLRRQHTVLGLCLWSDGDARTPERPGNARRRQSSMMITLARRSFAMYQRTPRPLGASTSSRGSRFGELLDRRTASFLPGREEVRRRDRRRVRVAPRSSVGRGLTP